MKKENDNIIKLPVGYHRRLCNKFGKGYVPCMISGRWLQFPEESCKIFREGEYLKIDLMTESSDDEPIKLCDLIVTKEDLMRAINAIEFIG